MMFAEIVIDIASGELDHSFSYRVPEELESSIGIGRMVCVPFGNGNRVRKGYVTELSDTSSYDEKKLKDILSVETGEETTEEHLIMLASWIRDTYGCTMIQALRTVFPVHGKMKVRQKRSIVLKCSEDEAREFLEKMKKGRGAARIRLLEAVLASPEHAVEYAHASKDLGTTASVVRFFEEQGILETESEEDYRLPVDPGKIPKEEPKELNPEQQEAVEDILSEWTAGSGRPVLIHGVTGSGKTEVYMRLIEETLSRGKQVIVLIPEISLTFQNVRRFAGRFGDRVSILNSKMSSGERYDQFVRAKQGKISVMVGPRSALFTPFTDLGLIIIDEEHEPAYKSESTPCYHARETAFRRAAMENAHVVLGSATPSLEAYSRAEEGAIRLIRLESRYEGRPLPSVEVVDLREELRKGNRSPLSRLLQDKMEDRLDKNEQTMLFLNRRGYAGFVSCRSCGHVMKCPHCDVSLSQHLGGTLVCHYCGYTEDEPKSCPVCGSPYIGGFKAGTQQVEQVIKKRFPKARVLRMDSDTTRSKGNYEEILSSFASHEADILLGTQMIVKGHDFPDVTLVGILAADLSLNSSDYRGAERTFQLLTQAAGRSGRGKSAGLAVIQTYHPEHYSIVSAAKQDYSSFYQDEMSFRRMMGYPPASHMLVIRGAARDEDRLARAMHYIAQFARKLSAGRAVTVVGPAPEAVKKIKDMYREALYLKCLSGEMLSALRERTEKYIEINPGFRDIYIQYDFT